jgi:hypothetical protein
MQPPAIINKAANTLAKSVGISRPTYPQRTLGRLSNQPQAGRGKKFRPWPWRDTPPRAFCSAVGDGLVTVALE